MYLKTKISLNFILITLLMLGVSLGYLLTSLYIEGQFAKINSAQLPAIAALNDVRVGTWQLWTHKDNEAELMRAFADVEADIILYSQLSDGNADTHSFEVRKLLLALQEDFQSEDFETFSEGAEAISSLVSLAMLEETEHLKVVGENTHAKIVWVGFISLGVIGGAILFGIVPGWWFSRVISKALSQTQEAADLVAEGDLSKRLPEDGKDEISELAVSFNHMVDNIREADEEITREVDERIRAERKSQIAAKAKSDFLAHMSHEFRTPLNGILGYSQMLSMDAGLSEKNLEVVKSLRKNGESLLELINDVLDLTKIEAQKMNVQKTRFYLGDFMDSVVETFEEQINQKGLEFKVALDKELPEDILSDQIRLRQILVNLLGNAQKFTDKGMVGISVVPLETGIRFKVEDSGIGIAEEDLNTIMQPFRQVDHQDRKNQGTGLGLSISNRLLEMMGSHLNIESVLGEGTTFWFDLPQPDIKHRKLVYSPTQITGYRGKARKILIGESGLETATMLMPLLQKVGFEALHLKSAESFLTKCVAFQPDVVLIDLYFGDADGVDVMKHLQARYEENQMPIVLLFSDHRAPSDRERSLRGGANDFIGVPVRFADLLNILKDELGLVWIEGESNTENKILTIPDMQIAEVIPPMAQLHELLELSRSGNVRHLKEQLKALQESDPTVAPFCERFLSFCAHYRVNAILKELEDLVGEDKFSSEKTIK